MPHLGDGGLVRGLQTMTYLQSDGPAQHGRKVAPGHVGVTRRVKLVQMADDVVVVERPRCREVRAGAEAGGGRQLRKLIYPKILEDGELAVGACFVKGGGGGVAEHDLSTRRRVAEHPRHGDRGPAVHYPSAAVVENARKVLHRGAGGVTVLIARGRRRQRRGVDAHADAGTGKDVGRYLPFATLLAGYSRASMTREKVGQDSQTL